MQCCGIGTGHDRRMLRPATTLSRPRTSRPLNRMWVHWWPCRRRLSTRVGRPYHCEIWPSGIPSCTGPRLTPGTKDPAGSHQLWLFGLSSASAAGPLGQRTAVNVTATMATTSDRMREPPSAPWTPAIYATRFIPQTGPSSSLTPARPGGFPGTSEPRRTLLSYDCENGGRRPAGWEKEMFATGLIAFLVLTLAQVPPL